MGENALQSLDRNRTNVSLLERRSLCADLAFQLKLCIFIDAATGSLRRRSGSKSSQSIR